MKQADKSDIETFKRLKSEYKSNIVLGLIFTSALFFNILGNNTNLSIIISFVLGSIFNSILHKESTLNYMKNEYKGLNRD